MDEHRPDLVVWAGVNVVLARPAPQRRVADQRDPVAGAAAPQAAAQRGTVRVGLDAQDWFSPGVVPLAEFVENLGLNGQDLWKSMA
ncbi:hypothetical protein [Saccharopolyspora thermophila]|uniref:Uncharacterized protein n=1 Tax=Saccharopolyspora thermophila TaxID=89367 RepID=A0ABP3NB89_9PSEU|nr:hypothetical protein [Saccharopolyspora subtropica]